MIKLLIHNGNKVGVASESVWEGRNNFFRYTLEQRRGEVILASQILYFTWLQRTLALNLRKVSKEVVK